MHPGTWFGKRIIRQCGLLRAGIVALAVQTGMLLVATAVYRMYLAHPAAIVMGPGASWLNATLAGAPVMVWVFSLVILLSRVGMWGFDMVNVQLFQQAVHHREISAASSMEMALCAFSELVMLGIAAYTADPASYR